jgi:hypothetical protein
VSWECRGARNARYYYRACRVSGKVVKRYLGRGVHARHAAQEDERRRTERESEQRAILAEMARTQPIGSLMAELDVQSKLLLEGMMLAAGYHRTNYGPWRRQRGV